MIFNSQNTQANGGPLAFTLRNDYGQKTYSSEDLSPTDLKHTAAVAAGTTRRRRSVRVAKSPIDFHSNDDHRGEDTSLPQSVQNQTRFSWANHPSVPILQFSLENG